MLVSLETICLHVLIENNTQPQIDLFPYHIQDLITKYNHVKKNSNVKAYCVLHPISGCSFNIIKQLIDKQYVFIFI
jgi:hypothetical protein